MEPLSGTRLLRPLSITPSVEVWSARLGRRALIVRRYPPARPGAPWPAPPDPAVLAAVNHPALARFLGQWRDEGDAVLHAFRHVPGRTLFEALQDGPLPAARWTDAMADASRGLRWLHARSAASPRLHGDVSPRNLLLAREGSARWLDVRADPPGVAPVPGGVILGTLPFLAPEVLQGDPPGTASEVFSLGLLGLVAAGIPLPWRNARDPAGVLDAFRRTSPASLATPLPAPAARLLAAMLAPAASDRPSATDVAARLR